MPFRLPSLCESCVWKTQTGDAYERIEVCTAFPSGIPSDITESGGSHFSKEGTGSELVYEMREDGEENFAAWASFWYTIEDGFELEEGVTGILPKELS